LRAGRQPVVLGAGRSQLGALLVVAGRAAARLPVLLLLNSEVPHIPGLATMLNQHCPLNRGRKQPISRHPDNITTTTDNPPKTNTPFPPSAKASGFHTATIQWS